MSVKRHVVKSCCGRQSFIFESDKAIRKFQLHVFEGAGFTAPDNFKDIGIFYVRDSTIIATASFGSKKINVKCFGDACQDKLDKFEELLNIATNTKIGKSK